MKHLLRSSIACFGLLGALLCGSQETQAQFSTPLIDGNVNGTTEYSGNNYASDIRDPKSPVWHITWDADNVYFAVTNVDVQSGSIVYIDSDPQPIVNGGTKSNGNLNAFESYDGIAGRLPFRADRAIYFKDGYQERRIATLEGNDDGSERNWAIAEPRNGERVGIYASRVYNLEDPNAPKVGAHEISIPWSKINKDGSSGPKIFNWLGFVTNNASGNSNSPGYGTGYGSVPFGNPLSAGPSTNNSSPQFVRYFTEYNVNDDKVNDNIATRSGGAAFSQNNSYTLVGTNAANFDGIDIYDFTVNTPGGKVSRANNGGNLLIRGSLKIGNGSIDLGGSNNPVTVDKDLIVYQNGSLQGGAAQLIVKGNFITEGAFSLDNPNSSLTLRAGGSTIQVGQNTFSIAKLYLDGTNRVLTNNITVSNTLSLTNGSILTTGSSSATRSENTITLGSTNTSASLIEKDGGYVLGKIVAYADLSANTTRDFGGIGLSLENKGLQSPGIVTVQRITGTQVTLSPNVGSITRQFVITTNGSDNGGLDIRLLFSYYDGTGNTPRELLRNNEELLSLYKSQSFNGPYNKLGGDVFTNTNQVEYGRNLPSLAQLIGYYTLGDGSAPLPVELASFSGQYANNSVLLKWTTASEKNNKGFAVERRVGEGSNWQPLAFVAGKSATGAAYSYVDATAPQGTSYYRLRQEDNDGTTAYSPVVAVLVAGQASGTLALSPVPTTDVLTISGFGDGKHVAEVYNLRGQRVLTQEISNAQATLSVSNLPSGVYLVRVQGTGSAQKGKFVKL